jgi:hypothetical protein
MALSEGQVIAIVAFGVLFVAAAALASGFQTVHAADHGAAKLAVRPGHGDQVREGPASRSRGRGGRLTGHPSEELSKQIWENVESGKYQCRRR